MQLINWLTSLLRFFAAVVQLYSRHAFHIEFTPLRPALINMQTQTNFSLNFTLPQSEWRANATTNPRCRAPLRFVEKDESYKRQSGQNSCIESGINGKKTLFEAVWNLKCSQCDAGILVPQHFVGSISGRNCLNYSEYCERSKSEFLFFLRLRTISGN